MIVLETERLLLRDPEVQDLEGFCAMEADFEVRRFVGGYPRTRQEAAARFRRGLRAKKSDLPFCTMIYKPERCSIGRCGLHPVPGGDVALGFYIARAYWGQGLATGRQGLRQAWVPAAAAAENRIDGRKRKHGLGPRPRETRISMGQFRTGRTTLVRPLRIVQACFDYLRLCILSSTSHAISA